MGTLASISIGKHKVEDWLFYPEEIDEGNLEVCSLTQGIAMLKQ